MTAVSITREGFEKISKWVFFIGEKGEIKWSNSHSREVIGFYPDEITGKILQNFLACEFDLETLYRNLPLRSPFKIFNLLFKTKSGKEQMVEVFFTPAEGEGHEKHGLLAFAQKVVETAEFYEDLKESLIAGVNKRILDAMISLFPTPVFYTDAEARYIGCNRAFEEFFGFQFEEIYGKTVAEIFPDENSHIYYQEDLDLIKHNAKQTKQIVLLDSRKEKHNALLIKTAYKDETGKTAGMLGMIVDVTPVKKEEEEKRRLELEAQHAQKLASLAMLAGGVAHDFNNMLTVILGNIELALAEIPSDSPSVDYLRDARTSCIKAADLCRQMLIYTGKSPYHKKLVNLNSILQEMDQLLQAAISRRLYIQYRFTQPLPLVEADPNQLKQAIMSLVVNASEAMGDKPGVITISTGYMKCDKSYLDTIVPACRVGLDKPLKQGTYVFLEVTDTGCGIPEEIQKKIFDPFFTTKFFGRGLGLAAVLGIVRTHRGGIKVYSEVGKGTTFKVLLPINGNGKLATAHANSSNKATAKETTQFIGAILVVDDEEPVRAIACRIFKKLGLKIYEASNGSEALIIFNKHKDEIDYVLLDFTMPGISAEEVFREMRLIKPGVKVVLCSGYAEEQAMAGFHGKGLAGFLQKPYDYNKLSDLLISLLPQEKKKSFEKGVQGRDDRPEKEA